MFDEDLLALMQFLAQMPDDAAIRIGGFHCHAWELRRVVQEAWDARQGQNREQRP